MKSRKAAMRAQRRVLAKRIRDAREALDITQQQLGDRLGVSAPCIAQWEAGDTAPDVARLPEVARELGVTVADLYGEARATA